MSVIFEGAIANRSIVAPLRVEVRIVNGRMQALMSRCADFIVANENEALIFEFDVGVSISIGDFPVVWRAIRTEIL